MESAERETRGEAAAPGQGSVFQGESAKQPRIPASLVGSVFTSTHLSVFYPGD